jgi:hypothetical protein
MLETSIRFILLFSNTKKRDSLLETVPAFCALRRNKLQKKWQLNNLMDAPNAYMNR